MNDADHGEIGPTDTTGPTNTGNIHTGMEPKRHPHHTRNSAPNGLNKLVSSYGKYSAGTMAEKFRADRFCIDADTVPASTGNPASPNESTRTPDHHTSTRYTRRPPPAPTIDRYSGSLPPSSTTHTPVANPIQVKPAAARSAQVAYVAATSSLVGYVDGQHEPPTCPMDVFV